VFRTIVAAGVADGSFAPVDINRVVRGMLSLSSIDLVRWYRLDGSDSPEQLGDFYSDLALKMVTLADRREGAPGGSTRRRTGRAPATKAKVAAKVSTKRSPSK
jgi:hypothetical protein